MTQEQLYFLAQTADFQLGKGSDALANAVQIESAEIPSHESRVCKDGIYLKEAQGGEASGTSSKEVLSSLAHASGSCVCLSETFERTAFFNSFLDYGSP